MTKELIKERGQAELASWQLVVTHSVALTPWEKIFRDAMPSFDCKKLQFNMFQHWGNCGENSLPASIVQAVQQASATCPHLDTAAGVLSGQQSQCLSCPGGSKGYWCFFASIARQVCTYGSMPDKKC